ncbi:MAG TPA: hypothetical protein VIU12_04775 [Chryseolinea sp.]
MEASISKNSTALKVLLLKAIYELSNVITDPRLDKDELLIYLKKKYSIPFLKSEESLVELIDNGLIVQSKDGSKVGINEKWQQTDFAQSVLI